MNRVLSFSVFVFLIISLLTGGFDNVSAQNAGSNDRYNLAVYATGLQDGSPISASVKSIAQNAATTNLTKGGRYQLIERSNDFLKQIEEETSFQQSGEVADDQIAELGSSYGAQKICVISLTIVEDYLYVAARVVDVDSKTSFESGDADVEGYSGVSQIRSTVVAATNPILGISDTVIATNKVTNVTSTPPSTNHLSADIGKKGNIEFSVNGISFKMVFVEGGIFQMGSFTGNYDEKPVHGVTISDFYVGETEVTQILWNSIMGDNNNPSIRLGDLMPVHKVKWIDCKEFIMHLNSLLANQIPQGYHFALLSEAEWEYAAKGGQSSSGSLYAGSSNIDQIAWYKKNSGNRVHEVKKKAPNALGLYDMSGNVWEWCEDTYSPQWYSVNRDWSNPVKTDGGLRRVLRGGSFDYSEESCRVTNRNQDGFNVTANDYGFRIALVRR